MKISITQDPVVRVQCECGLAAHVPDLEAAVVWAFHESVRHGKGSKLDMTVDITIHAHNMTQKEKNDEGLGFQ